MRSGSNPELRSPESPEECLRTQVGLHLPKGEDLAGVANGTYAAELAQLTEGLLALDRPAYVRVGFEFNGEWNGYFRHVNQQQDGMMAMLMAVGVGGPASNPKGAVGGMDFGAQPQYFTSKYQLNGSITSFIDHTIR